jgi:hypothetical protein
MSCTVALVKGARLDRLPIMPGSNFLRSRWVLYTVVAVVLGCVSPAIAGLLDFSDPATRQGLLYWWFAGIPAGTDARLWPLVFTLQYLLVFSAGAALVLLIQQWTAPPKPAQLPPHSERAFDQAAAMYHLHDGW